MAKPLSERDIWTEEAKKALKLKPPELFLYYIGRSYLKAVEKVLRYLNNYITRYKVNILKVDLWNEGIEYHRDILGRYQEYENLNL